MYSHTLGLLVLKSSSISYSYLIWFSGFGRQTKNGARNLFLLVGTLTIASLIAFLYLYQTNQPVVYFLMPTRFWEMVSDVFIYLFSKKIY